MEKKLFDFDNFPCKKAFLYINDLGYKTPGGKFSTSNSIHFTWFPITQSRRNNCQDKAGSCNLKRPSFNCLIHFYKRKLAVATTDRQADEKPLTILLLHEGPNLPFWPTYSHSLLSCGPPSVSAAKDFHPVEIQARPCMWREETDETPPQLGCARFA